MVSNEIIASIGLDATDVYAEVDAMKSATDALVADWNIKRNRMITQANAVMSMTSQITRIYKNMIIAMGGTVDPLTEALLQTIQTVALSSAAAGRIIQTVGGPVGWILGGVFVMLALRFQMDQQRAAEQGMAEVQRQFNAARGAILQIESLTSQVARWF